MSVPDVDLDGRLQFHRQFYDAECSRTPADVVIARHVIEHVAQPRELLSSIRAALNSNPDARVFLETPCVEWILRHRVAWDFFYEHCSLFTVESLSTAAEESGFDVKSVPTRLWRPSTCGWKPLRPRQLRHILRRPAEQFLQTEPG